MAGLPEPGGRIFCWRTCPCLPGHHKDLAEEMTCLYQQVNKILLERAFASASVMKMFTVMVTMKYVMEHVIEDRAEESIALTVDACK
jgi:hypothetical protein